MGIRNRFRGPAWFLGAAGLAALMALTGCSGKSSSSSDGSQASPPGGGAASDAAAVQAIHQKIAADAAMKGAQVKVGLQGGTVMLDGSVRSLDQKNRAEQIVLQVQNEKHLQQGVFNNLNVADSGSPSSGDGSGSH